MLARFDYRPMLTAVLALSTTVLLVVVVTLLITLPPSTSPASHSVSGNPPAASANRDAPSENYGWDILHNK